MWVEPVSMTDTTEDPGLRYEYSQIMYMQAALGTGFEAAMARGVPDTPANRQRFAELEQFVADVGKRGGQLWGFSD